MPGRSWCGHRQHRPGRGRGPDHDREAARQPGRGRAGHRRLSLQRPQAAGRASGHGRGAGEIPDQPGNVARNTTTPTSRPSSGRRSSTTSRPDRVNWGSLDQALLTELMRPTPGCPNPRRPRCDDRRDDRVRDALGRAGRGDGLPHDRISCRQGVGRARPGGHLRRLAPRSDYPLHLGLTEAGMGMKGIVASTAGLAVLLDEGSGHDPRLAHARARGAELEVEVAQQVLQSMGLRAFLPRYRPVRAAAAPRPPSSRRWPRHYRAHQGADAGLARRLSGRRGAQRGGDGCVVNGLASPSTPTSGSACRARSKHRWRRCSSMEAGPDAARRPDRREFMISSRLRGPPLRRAAERPDRAPRPRFASGPSSSGGHPRVRVYTSAHNASRLRNVGDQPVSSCRAAAQRLSRQHGGRDESRLRRCFAPAQREKQVPQEALIAPSRRHPGAYRRVAGEEDISCGSSRYGEIRVYRGRHVGRGRGPMVEVTVDEAARRTPRRGRAR